jgi:hypothetical protein
VLILPGLRVQGTKELHQLLAKDPTSVSLLECEEKADEEGCMNMITGGSRIPEGGAWRSPDSSWLDLEEEVDGEEFMLRVRSSWTMEGME